MIDFDPPVDLGNR